MKWKTCLSIKLRLTWKWVAGLAVFSFLLTLPRELVKDLEDLEGDRQAGFRTFPALAGEQATLCTGHLLACGSFSTDSIYQQVSLAVL